MGSNTQTFRLPAAQLPNLTPLAVGPCYLRPLTLADEPMAFILAKIAFLSHNYTATAADMVHWQQLWQASGRGWAGWLHQQSHGSAWAVVCGEDGPLVGYVRAIRNTKQQVESLTELYVHPLFQQATVGKTLLTAALAPAVPSGWQRIIIADSNIAALGLYYHWGTYPAATAWYVESTYSPATITQLNHRWPHATYTVQAYDNNRDQGAIDALDQQIFHRTRCSDRNYLHQHTAYRQVVLWHDHQVVGYAFHSLGAIGPVVAATPQDALYLIQSIIITAAQHQTSTFGCWVPHQQSTLLHWLRSQAQQVRLLSSVTIMLAQPLPSVCFDSCLITAHPYLL